MNRTFRISRDASLPKPCRRKRFFVASVSSLLLLAGIGCGGPIPPPAKDVEYTQAMATARISFERGHPDQAAVFYEQALRRAEARDDAADIADAAYDLALCLIRTKHYDRAHVLLTEARHELQRAGLRIADVRLLEAKLAYQTGDLPAADRIAAEVANTAAATAAERCESLVLRGTVAMDRGNPQEAARFITQAKAVLRNDSSSRSIARPSLAASITGIEARLAASDSLRAAALYDQQARLWQEAGLYADMSEALLQAGRAYAAGGSHRAAAQRYARAARSRRAQGDLAGAETAAEAARAEAQQAGDPDLIATLPLPASRPAAKK
jgi:tetratricopeptide (TPR) repeat protein